MGFDGVQAESNGEAKGELRPMSKTVFMSIREGLKPAPGRHWNSCDAAPIVGVVQATHLRTKLYLLHLFIRNF